ncbi:MAG: hypothetical protein AB7T14_08975 [Candidatus Methylacidiphilaceae bacterium]
MVEPRPEHYGMLFFSLAGQVRLHPITLSGIGSLNVIAYVCRQELLRCVEPGCH